MTDTTLSILGGLPLYVLIFLGIAGFLFILNRGETAKIEQLKIVDRQTTFSNEVALRGIRASEDLTKELAMARIDREAMAALQVESIKAATAQAAAMAAQAESSRAQIVVVQKIGSVLEEVMPKLTSGQGEIKQGVTALPEIIKLNTREQLDEQSIHVLEKINQSLEAGVTPKVGIIQINSQGRVVLANPVALKLLGLSSEQTIGKPFYNIGLKVVNSDHKALEDFASLPFAEALSTGILTIKHAIIGIQAQDKSYKWVAMEMQLIDGAEVTTPQILLTFVDAGEIVTMEGEITGAYPKEAAKPESPAAAPEEVKPEEAKPPVHIVVDAPADTPVIIATDASANKAAVAAVAAVSDSIKKAEEAVQAAIAEDAAAGE